MEIAGCAQPRLQDVQGESGDSRCVPGPLPDSHTL